MILFFDLNTLDNEIAYNIGKKEKVAFVHDVKNAIIKGDNIKYYSKDEISKITDVDEIDFVILNRGMFAVRSTLNPAFNILHYVSGRFPDAMIIILYENEGIPTDIPIHIPFKFVVKTGTKVNEVIGPKLGMMFDVEEINSICYENIYELINNLRIEKELSMRIAKSKKPVRHSTGVENPSNLDSSKINILFVKRTSLASAPDELAKSINKYFPEFHVDLNFVPKAGYNIIHYHNIYMAYNCDHKVIQYHSEPVRVTLPNMKIPNSKLTGPFPEIKLVLAQYHATLPEYCGMIPVRNVINFDGNSQYDPKPTPVDTPLRVSYSPSVLTRVNQYFDKGYEVTKKILESVKGIEFDIITGVSLDECLKRKVNSDIVIDECVTGSYHRSGLEGLALGKMTICWLSDKTKKVFVNSITRKIDDIEEIPEDSRKVPFENVNIEELKGFLEECVARPKEEILKIGEMNRKWMEKYWHPKDVTEDFVRIYRKMMN